ncbi:hypothetical protein Tco_0164054 [Tanacetum coccineum]
MSLTHLKVYQLELILRPGPHIIVQHSIGNDEEFVTVGPSNINTVKRTPGSMSSIYHELLNKKDRGMVRNNMAYPRPEEYDYGPWNWKHYLKYIDNDVWKVIQNGNSKNRISTRKDGVIRVLPPISVAEIHAVEKERRLGRTILLMAIHQGSSEKI